MEISRHIPVLAKEVIELLAPGSGEIFVDATIGLGGHAKQILPKLGKTGRLIGIDQDEQALGQASHNLRTYAQQLVLVCGNFAAIGTLVQSAGHARVSGILFDLGVSSLQLDDPDRGFSFNKSDKLDMRMSANTALTAEEVVNSYSRDELARIFYEYGQETRARAIAKRITEARKSGRITTVAQLIELIGPPSPKPPSLKSFGRSQGYGRAGGGHRRIHPATKVFQALRIEVNQELEALEEALPKAFELLESGGRMAVISFHSLEDRIVKNFFRNLKTGGSGLLLTKKAVTPSWEERRGNPRARSAKLRAIKKI